MSQAFMMRIKPEKRLRVKHSEAAMKAREGAGVLTNVPHLFIAKTMKA
jgi:hypothetical protein